MQDIPLLYQLLAGGVIPLSQAKNRKKKSSMHIEPYTFTDS